MNLLSVDPARFWAKVDTSSSGCWEWKGTKQAAGDYGRTYIPADRSNTSAHRVAFVLAGGTIPDGYEIDHLCRNRACVRPDHLEAVTPAENVRRSESPAGRNARKDKCDKGHPFTRVEAKSGSRVCCECKIVAQRRRREAERQVNPPPPHRSYSASKTHCPQGHPYDETNTYVTRRGSRMCRACMRIRNKRRRDALTADAQDAAWSAGADQ